MKYRILSIVTMMFVLSWTGYAREKENLRLTGTFGDSMENVGGCSVSETDGSFDIVSKQWKAGIMLRGKWDLREYKSIRLTVENRSDVTALYLVCDMFDSRRKSEFRDRANRAVAGVYEAVGDVPTGSKITVEFPLSPDMPHPEVNGAFRLMHGTPYSRELGLFSYDIDLSDVHTIVIAGVNLLPGVEFTVSDVELIRGKRSAPKAMQLDSAAFFPFVDAYGQYKYRDWPGKVHSDRDLKRARLAEEKDLAAHPGPDDWDIYGGWKGGPRYEATGQFYVKKIDGKWWMIDPEGYLYWSHGVVRVTTSSAVTPLDGRRFYFSGLPEDESDPFHRFYFTHDNLLHPYYTARGIHETYDFSSANAYRKYGEDYKAVFADLAHRRLRSWGMNTMANSSDPSICAMDRTVYNERVDLGAPVAGCPKWPVLEGSGGWWPFIDPFDNLFPMCVRAHLEAKRAQLEDSWCQGFYVDNEINWGAQTMLAGLALKASPKQASKLVLIDRLMDKYSSVEALNKAWGTAFEDWNALVANRKALPSAANADLSQLSLLIVRQYFKTVREVFKQVAPNKLYMGCRFAGAPEFVVRIAAEYVDVMSYNNYTYTRETFSLPKGIDLPVMYGEFHFGALDRGLFHTGQVATFNQKNRARAYGDFVRSCLKNPCIIGTNWHQFSDQPCTGRFDGEDFQVGLTDCCDTPYPETIAALREVGYNMYEIRYGKAE